MKLVIGGFAQGKLGYVLNSCRPRECIVLDGSLSLSEEPGEKALVVNHLHSWIRECLLRGGHPEEEVLAFAERHPDCIWISDEIGNGIVPVDAFEREYRERTGRIQVMLAERAEEVVRVICGIGQKIK